MWTEIKKMFVVIMTILILNLVAIFLIQRNVDKKEIVKVDTVTVKVPIYTTIQGKPIEKIKWDTISYYVKGDTVFIYAQPIFVAKADTVIADSNYTCDLNVEYSYPDNLFNLKTDIKVRVLKETIFVTKDPKIYKFWAMVGYNNSLKNSGDNSAEILIGSDFKDKYKLYLKGGTDNNIGIGIGYNF